MLAYLAMQMHTLHVPSGESVCGCPVCPWERERGSEEDIRALI